jgi:galactose mutarotase-like enzyme
VSRPQVTDTTWEGFDALALDNGRLRVTVVPVLGGHIAEVVDVVAGRNLLWRNPRLTPRQAPYGAWFDDWWSGGWDEIFPSGDSGRLHGETLPYMGELWCLPWSASAGSAHGAAWIDSWVEGNITPARFERRLELRPFEGVLRVSYRITSLDVRPLPFTWGIHPAFAVTAAHRIDVPASSMLVGVSSDPSMGVVGASYAWPLLGDESAAGGMRDVRRVRPREDAVFGGHWATDLADGWLSMTDTAARRGIAYVFDREVFPHAWLWQVYGGWRAQHHVALEAWTSHPMDLEGAVAAGRARILLPGEVLQTEVAFVLHEGLEVVAAIERATEGFVVR